MLKPNCTCDDSGRTIKNIHVFANGEKYSGQRIVLNQSRWHHILNDITLKLDPYFGKVEKLYTTTSGLSIYSFTDLQNNATYVASNRIRRFLNVKGGYTVDTEPTQEYFEHYLSSQLQRINKYKKLVYVRRDLLVIYIFRNGECGQSFKIVLTSDDLSSWSHILSYVALILDVPERCIKSLHSVNGNKICGPWELQHGASYVAVGYSESFRKGCYHADHKSTEVVTTGFPVVPKDRNLICTHKVRRKMKPPFKWNHYDQYQASNHVQRRKSSKQCKNCSRKSQRNSSQANSEYKSDDKSVRDKSEENKSVENSSKKNKRVTVHMRIQNPVTSNVMITRNSGDSSPTHKKKKKWKDGSSSDSSDNYNNTSANNSSMCTSETCASTSTKRNKDGNKYHSEPTSPSSSSGSEIPASRDKKKHAERNLTWKHMNNESQGSLKKGEKVSVHVKGGQAVILGGSSGNSNQSLATKKSSKLCKKKSDKRKSDKKKQKKNSDSGNCGATKSILKTNKSRSKTKKNCSSSCVEDECKFYNIAKSTKDKYKCPNFASSSKHSKSKHNKDNSDSRIKNRNYLMSCKEAAECKELQNRKPFWKRLSDLLFDSSTRSSTTIDSSKKQRCRKQGKPCPCDDDDTDTENSSNMDEHSKPNSSCTICRIQLDHRNLIKRYKK